MKNTALLCTWTLLAPVAAAWNDTGHRAIAFLAYSHLNAKVRQRVNAILRAHPDFAAILSRGASAAPFDVDRNAFVTATTWPDIIRNDKRFSDAPKGPPLPGFPDMGRHTKWHYINVPVPEAFKHRPVDPDNAVASLSRLLGALRRSGPVNADEAYALPWILHIVTDLHQPLHTVARFSTANGHTDHDRGGNACYVSGGSNLHAVWDGLLGREASEGAIARLAVSLGDEHPQPRTVDRKPETWVEEGVAAAFTHVYTFNVPCGDRNAPAPLPDGYIGNAASFARARAALAAYRVAAILNERLGG